eukprot:5864207-Amphidinium_carterae.1
MDFEDKYTTTNRQFQRTEMGVIMGQCAIGLDGSIHKARSRHLEVHHAKEAPLAHLAQVGCAATKRSDLQEQGVHEHPAQQGERTLGAHRQVQPGHELGDLLWQ